MRLHGCASLHVKVYFLWLLYPNLIVSADICSMYTCM